MFRGLKRLIQLSVVVHWTSFSVELPFANKNTFLFIKCLGNFAIFARPEKLIISFYCSISDEVWKVFALQTRPQTELVSFPAEKPLWHEARNTKKFACFLSLWNFLFGVAYHLISSLYLKITLNIIEFSTDPEKNLDPESLEKLSVWVNKRRGLSYVICCSPPASSVTCKMRAFWDQKSIFLQLSLWTNRTDILSVTAKTKIFMICSILQK